MGKADNDLSLEKKALAKEKKSDFSSATKKSKDGIVDEGEVILLETIRFS